MKDLTQNCLSDINQAQKQINQKPATISDLREIYCAVCRNPECVNMRNGDPFPPRISTQLERFSNPNQADPTLPMYARIIGQDFQDLLHRAQQLEISARNNDWEIPEVPSISPIAENSSSCLVPPSPSSCLIPPSPIVTEPVIKNPPSPNKPKPPTQSPPKKTPLQPIPRNTEVPKEGLFLGDSAGTPPPEPAVDPWEIPSERVGERRVQAGAQIKLGESGEILD